VTETRPGAHERVTLQDVADRAGVSLTTASRVVSDGSRRVGKPLADRVQQAVADLGYTANLQARAVATGRSTMIGVALRDISDPYFATIAAGLIEVAAASGQLVCMSSTAATEAAERDYVALMRAQRARAVVLVGSRSDDIAARDALRAELAAFTRAGGRAACVGQDLLGVDTVLPENRAGAEALGRALAALGYRRFAVLAGPRTLLTGQDRTDGFARGLRGWPVPREAVPREEPGPLGEPGPLAPVRVVHGDLSRDGGYAAMSEILAVGEPLPDCVFAVSDIMAVGALARLRAAGLSVPGDIALAGFDDIPTLRDVYPPLTTVRLPLKELGQTAARLVLSGDAPRRPRVVPVPGEVVLRASTPPRPLPAARHWPARVLTGRRWPRRRPSADLARQSWEACGACAD
jgi:LacI family transcriptional regulator, galactose operon repressor